MSSRRTENFSYVRWIVQFGVEIFYDVPRFTPEKTTAEISVLTSIFLASFNQVPVFRHFSEPLAVTLCHVSLFNGICGIDHRNNRQFYKMDEYKPQKNLRNWKRTRFSIFYFFIIYHFFQFYLLSSLKSQEISLGIYKLKWYWTISTM